MRLGATRETEERSVVHRDEHNPDSVHRRSSDSDQRAPAAVELVQVLDTSSMESEGLLRDGHPVEGADEVAEDFQERLDEQEDLDARYGRNEASGKMNVCHRFYRWWKFRYTILLMASLSVVISYADRSNMSVAILAMDSEFGWSNSTDGWVLSSFFGGYTSSQVAGGYLADRFGGERVLTYGVFFWSLFTLLTPIASRIHISVLFLTRILMGLGEGIGFPSILSMISRWIPVSEQSTAVSIAVSASYIGTVLALEASPKLEDSLGWESIFYFFGVIGFVWCGVWLVMPIKRHAPQQTVSKDHLSDDDSSPAAVAPIDGSGVEEDGEPGMTVVIERATSYGDTADPTEDIMDRGLLQIDAWVEGDDANRNHSEAKHARIPWKRILTRKEVWAIVINQFCNSWGFYILLNYLPKYFNTKYHVDIKDTSTFTVGPFIGQGIVGILSGVFADAALKRGWMAKLTLRKVMQTLGMIGPAIFLFIIVRIDPNPGAASALITAALSMNSLTLVGVSVSQLDIAPKYAGIVYGMGNTAACIPGLIAVPLTGWMLDGHGGWTLVFVGACFMYVIGAIVWLFMAGARVVVN